MSRSLRVALVLMAVPLLAGSLRAQSLGELAAKEKRRREEEQKKNNGPARVVTTEDLAKVTATTANDTGPVLAQDMGGPRGRDDRAPSDETRRPGNAAPTGDSSQRGGIDEKQWRADAAQLRKEIQAAEAKVKALDEQVGQLFAQIQRSTDTYEILRLRAEQDKLAEQTKIGKEELANYRREQAEFEENARRAGVPPGWIR